MIVRRVLAVAVVVLAGLALVVFGVSPAPSVSAQIMPTLTPFAGSTPVGIMPTLTPAPRWVISNGVCISVPASSLVTPQPTVTATPTATVPLTSTPAFTYSITPLGSSGARYIPLSAAMRNVAFGNNNDHPWGVYEPWDVPPVDSGPNPCFVRQAFGTNSWYPSLACLVNAQEGGFGFSAPAPAAPVLSDTRYLRALSVTYSIADVSGVPGVRLFGWDAFKVTFCRDSVGYPALGVSIHISGEVAYRTGRLWSTTKIYTGTASECTINTYRLPDGVGSYNTTVIDAAMLSLLLDVPDNNPGRSAGLSIAAPAAGVCSASGFDSVRGITKTLNYGALAYLYTGSPTETIAITGMFEFPAWWGIYKPERFGDSYAVDSIQSGVYSVSGAVVWDAAFRSCASSSWSYISLSATLPTTNVTPTPTPWPTPSYCNPSVPITTGLPVISSTIPISWTVGDGPCLQLGPVQTAGGPIDAVVHIDWPGVSFCLKYYTLHNLKLGDVDLLPFVVTVLNAAGVLLAVNVIRRR